MTRGHTWKAVVFLIAQWLIVMVVYIAIVGTFGATISASLLAGQLPSAR